MGGSRLIKPFRFETRDKQANEVVETWTLTNHRTAPSYTILLLTSRGGKDVPVASGYTGAAGYLEE